MIASVVCLGCQSSQKYSDLAVPGSAVAASDVPSAGSLTEEAIRQVGFDQTAQAIDETSLEVATTEIPTDGMINADGNGELVASPANTLESMESMAARSRESLGRPARRFGSTMSTSSP